MAVWSGFDQDLVMKQLNKLDREIKRLCRLFDQGHQGYRILHLVARGKMSADEGALAIRKLIARKKVGLPPV